MYQYWQVILQMPWLVAVIYEQQMELLFIVCVAGTLSDTLGHVLLMCVVLVTETCLALLMLTCFSPVYWGGGAVFPLVIIHPRPPRN
jgi:hypothetical protein